MSKSTIEVRFPGSHGLTLAARLDLPARQPTAYALFAHCFTCSKDSKAASYISSSLAAAGIAVGQVDSFDQFVVLLKNSVNQMVYKHAISTIVPARNVRLPMPEGESEDSDD